MEIIANKKNVICLGIAGENKARQVKFQYPVEWIDDFPNGNFEVHVKRAGDHSIYKAQQIEDDRSNYTLTLTVTSTETSYAGGGEMQLCYIVDEVIVKSERYKTVVEKAITIPTPTEPPADTIIEDAVNDYIEQHVNVITVNNHGENGEILTSNGDGSYTWQNIDSQIVDSDSGSMIVPTRTLNRLARVIRQKTGYEGDMTVETMAEVLEQTDMWTTEEYCLNLAPAAAELTITLSALPLFALSYRQNISKVILPYCGVIQQQAFANSAVASIEAPNVTILAGASCFAGCASLVQAVMPALTTVQATYVFSGCSALVKADYPMCRYINGQMFLNCISLTDVLLPECVNAYNNATNAQSVFNGCRALGEISLPKFQGVMAGAWLDGCWLLEEAIFPKLTQITGNYNFRNCYELKKLYAPECTVWTGTQNFLNCNSLRRMCFYTKPTTISNTLFSGAPVLMDIYVSWSQGEVAGAPWGAPAGCTVHYDTQYDEDGEPIIN